ncbi:hypothetical protein [Curtobacterium sp. MCBD17_040]|uniref:hypothetical protein n=1 Tax=Curtobacterium sp. MCBD17_040 TaxID=2175674 RepID=UPI0011B57163|nr:hypothetical protein [Curtobacterium sp. MCBD17_040]WIB65309.1 hypothetical protein DEI94_18050 [Curtobacterium sp. MCBD17_040]
MNESRHMKGAPQSQGGRFRSSKEGVGDGGVALGYPDEAVPFTGSAEYAERRFSAADNVSETFTGTAVSGSHTDVEYTRTVTIPATPEAPKATLRVVAHVGDADVRRRPSTVEVDMWTGDGWKRVLSDTAPTEGETTWRHHRDRYSTQERDDALEDWKDAVANLASDKLIDALRIVS